MEGQKCLSCGSDATCIVNVSYQNISKVYSCGFHKLDLYREFYLASVAEDEGDEEYIKIFNKRYGL